MTNLKFFYVKLSCPKDHDKNKFYDLFASISGKKTFDFELENIPNNLERASVNDIVFIHIGGDSSNKRKYFKDSPELSNYTNGVYCLGKINKIQPDLKIVSVSIIGLDKVVTKEDLYFFPQFINNLGASTKGTPNQAGLYELKESVSLGLIEYFYERKILERDLEMFSDLKVNDKLFSKALSDYKSNFSEKKLTKKIFQKYTNENFSKENNDLINEFVNWFHQKNNFKASYKGIVNIENLKFWDRTYFNSETFKINRNNKLSSFNKIRQLILNNTDTDWIDFNNSFSKGAPKAVLGERNYLKFLEEYITSTKYEEIELNLFDKDEFKLEDFIDNCKNSGLKLSEQIITRYISSLLTKPFVLLSGLSGSGKTKLAQSFAQWLCESKEQYCIVPVGADWTNREPLLGYVNALEPEKYILPENKALELLIKANTDESKPYFLILDEMNLSHVERYFADFLSVMESKDKFKLHSSTTPLKSGNGLEIEREYSWPKNLFVVGTVNIDETTYMFSPKVLDRANVIEFRIGEDEMAEYLSEPKQLTDLNGEGKTMGESFVSIAKEESKANPEELKNALQVFFKALKVVGAEFGYRTASEIQTLFSKIDTINPEYASKKNDKIDFAIMQKLLPKLHGSRSKLVPILKTLAGLCYVETLDKKQVDTIFEDKEKEEKGIKYPISLEKIERMYNNVITNGFTSYAEA